MRLTLQEKILVQQLVEYDIWHYQTALDNTKQYLTVCTIEKERETVDLITEYEKNIKIRKIIYDKFQKDFNNMRQKEKNNEYQ